jgi:hypothetical protein
MACTEAIQGRTITFHDPDLIDGVPEGRLAFWNPLCNSCDIGAE